VVVGAALLTGCSPLHVSPTKTISYCASGYVNQGLIDNALEHLGGGSLDPYPFPKVVEELKRNGGAIVYYNNRVIHIHLATGGYRRGQPFNPARMGPFYPPTDHADIAAAAIVNSSRDLQVWVYLKKMPGWRFEFSAFRHNQHHDICSWW
jgi:hypothetical protein